MGCIAIYLEGRNSSKGVASMRNKFKTEFRDAITSRGKDTVKLTLRTTSPPVIVKSSKIA